MDEIVELCSWYFEHCDGEWEHDKRIRIQTLDNPGWSVHINLEDTELENRPFQELVLERSDSDWIYCGVRDKEFWAAGGPLNLQEMLRIFLDWARAD